MFAHLSFANTKEFIYIIFILWSAAWFNCPELVHTTAGGCNRVVVFFLLYGGSRTYKCIITTYLSNGPLALYRQSQLGVSMVHLTDSWRNARRRRVTCRLLCKRAQDSWTVRRIRGKKRYKYCSVSCTNRSFRVFRPQCIVTSHRFSFGFVCVCFFLSQICENH